MIHRLDFMISLAQKSYKNAFLIHNAEDHINNSNVHDIHSITWHKSAHWTLWDIKMTNWRPSNGGRLRGSSAQLWPRMNCCWSRFMSSWADPNDRSNGGSCLPFFISIAARSGSIISNKLYMKCQKIQAEATLINTHALNSTHAASVLLNMNLKLWSQTWQTICQSINQSIRRFFRWPGPPETFSWCLVSDHEKTSCVLRRRQNVASDSNAHLLGGHSRSDGSDAAGGGPWNRSLDMGPHHQVGIYIDA